MFLTSAFLLALPLAAAPILLHLFDRQRNVTIEWGAMQFLMEAAARKTSARKLKQWLLLLLRCLAVLALVLALARPMLPGHWFGSTERTETVLVLDNSMSTTRTVAGDTTVFDRLRDEVSRQLDDVKSGDTIRVLLTSPYPVWATAGSIRMASESREALSRQLAELKPTSGSGDLLAALLTAVQSDVEPEVTTRQVVLLTDGQATDWKTDDTAGWERFQQVLAATSIRTGLNIVDLEDADRKTQNLSVSDLRSSRTVVGIHQSFTMTAKIRNHSSLSSKPATLRWTSNDDVLLTETVPEIEGGSSREPVCRHTFDKTGVYTIHCKLDGDDDLPADDAAAVVVEVVDHVPILVVDNAPDSDETEQDAWCLQAALGWMHGEQVAQTSVHRPVVATPDQLERMLLQEYPAVVIPSLQELSSDTVRKLAEFVDGGGGLWIALGPRTNAEQFNQLFYAAGTGLSPLPLESMVQEDSDAGRRTTINPFLRDHPATAALADDDKVDTSDVHIERRFRFVPPAQDDDVSVLLNLTNSEPLAVEKYVGQGRVIIQTVPLKLQWSSLAQSSAFVVMVQDWLAYLTQPQATRYNLAPGEPISVHLKDSEFRDAVLKTPHGDEIELTADAATDGVVFRSGRTILPGEYVLELALSGDRLPFHVSREAGESDLSLLNDEQRRMMAKATGLGAGLMSLASSVGTNRDPAWHVLLILLIVFMTLELLLAGWISRERFGGEAISETTGIDDGSRFGLPMAFASKATMSDPVSSREESVPEVHS
ncbi:MAG: BatA domain-containing protein [Planctomycetaceae bacterium]